MRDAAGSESTSPDPIVLEPIPTALGGRRPPGYVERDPVSVAVTSLLRVNARTIARRIPPGPLVDPDALGLAALRSSWPVVRGEWDALRSEIARLPTVDQLMERDRGWDGQWESYGVRGPAGWFDHAERTMPETVRLLKGIDGLVQASFSVLTPGSLLHPHRGPNTGVVRGLLGVVVPEPDQCGLVVGDQRLHLIEGGCLAFDDTFEHVSWNRGTQDRVTLLLEIRWDVRGVPGLVNRLTQRAFQYYPMVVRGNRRFGRMLGGRQVAGR